MAQTRRTTSDLSAERRARNEEQQGNLVQLLRVVGQSEVPYTFSWLNPNELRDKIIDAAGSKGLDSVDLKSLRHIVRGPVLWHPGDQMSLSDQEKRPVYRTQGLPKGGIVPSQGPSIWDFDSCAVDCIATALYMLRLGEDRNDRDVDSWRNNARKRHPAMEALVELLTLEWERLSACQLLEAKMPFYDECMELVKKGKTAAARARLELQSVPDLWTALVRTGLNPWAFTVQDRLTCASCKRPVLSDEGPYGVGLIEAPWTHSASVQESLDSWFKQRRVLDRSSSTDNALPSCTSCGRTAKKRYRQVCNDGQLPRILIVSLGDREVLGPTTPTRIVVTYANTTNGMEIATYQWLLSICGGTASGRNPNDEGRNRVYHATCDPAEVLRYDPYVDPVSHPNDDPLPARIQQIRSTGDPNSRVEPEWARRTTILVLERRPKGKEFVAWSEFMAKGGTSPDPSSRSATFFDSQQSARLEAERQAGSEDGQILEPESYAEDSGPAVTKSANEDPEAETDSIAPVDWDFSKTPIVHHDAPMAPTDKERNHLWRLANFRPHYKYRVGERGPKEEADLGLVPKGDIAPEVLHHDLRGGNTYLDDPPPSPIGLVVWPDYMDENEWIESPKTRYKYFEARMRKSRGSGAGQQNDSWPRLLSRDRIVRRR